MSRLSGKIDLHRVKSISLDRIREMETDDGAMFCTRALTIVFEDESDFTIDLFARVDDTPDGKDCFDALQVRL